MAICINRKSPEYQNLKERSGIPELLLDGMCREYLERFDRLPNLDELTGSNSKPYLEKALNLNSVNGTTVDLILKVSGASNIDQAVINLNGIYTDQEVDIIPVDDEAMVSITPRPTELYKHIDTWYDPDENPDMTSLMNHVIDKLQTQYGIKVNSITDSELESDKWNMLIPHDKAAKAFVFNNEIYINVDRATKDSLIHEMMHLLIGSIRFNNPSLYQKLIDSAESFANYEDMARTMRGKTRNSLNEELFVEEIAKYLAGLDSQIKVLSEQELHEINYNVKRVLDSVLMGDLSVKTIDDHELFNMTFEEVVKATNSNVLTNPFTGAFDLKSSELHRKINNVKEELLRQGTLEEQCN